MRWRAWRAQGAFDVDLASDTLPTAGIVSAGHGLRSEPLSSVAISTVRQPARMVAFGRRRQDSRQQQHDRSRGLKKAGPTVWLSSGSVFKWFVDGPELTAHSGFGGGKLWAQKISARDALFGQRLRMCLVPKLVGCRKSRSRTGKDQGAHTEMTGRVGQAILHSVDASGRPEQKTNAQLFRQRRFLMLSSTGDAGASQLRQPQ